MSIYTVHGILQARTLEWVAIPFSRGSSQPRDQTQVSHITGRLFTVGATKEAQKYRRMSIYIKKVHSLVREMKWEAKKKYNILVKW